MGFRGNHEIPHSQKAFIFRTFFWHLSGSIEQIYTHYEMSYVFN